MQAHHSRNMVVLPPLIATVLSLSVFLMAGMSLNRLSATALVGIYVGYAYYSMMIFAEDKD